MWHFSGFPPLSGSRSILDDAESFGILNQALQLWLELTWRFYLLHFLWELQLSQPVSSSLRRGFSCQNLCLSKLGWDLIIFFLFWEGEKGKLEAVIEDLGKNILKVSWTSRVGNFHKHCGFFSCGFWVKNPTFGNGVWFLLLLFWQFPFSLRLLSINITRNCFLLGKKIKSFWE